MRQGVMKSGMDLVAERDEEGMAQEKQKGWARGSAGF